MSGKYGWYSFWFLWMTSENKSWELLYTKHTYINSKVVKYAELTILAPFKALQ